MPFTDPISNIARLFLNEGMRVVDFGSGSGFYSIETAKMVGEFGKIYSIDIQRDLLSKLKAQAIRQGLKNVETICSDIELPGSTKMKGESIDAAIISNTIFQIKEKKVLADEVFRVLRHNGKVLVIDWSESFGGIGPHRDQVFRVGDAKSLFIKSGFKLLSEFDAGEHHYGLIFIKK